MKYFTVLNICLFFVLIKIRYAISQNFEADVEKAIKKAREKLSSEMYKESPNGGIDMGSHSYVKISALTELIGLKSNENFLAYEDLLEQGYPKEIVLGGLRSRRLDICTQSVQPGSCDPSYPYRSINGTCNNLQNPHWGSLLEPFHRLLGNSYSDSYNQPKGGRISSTLPNARLVSSTVIQDRLDPDPTLTNFVPQFGQFLDHDLSLTPEGDHHCCTTSTDTDCWSIAVGANDPFYSKVRDPQTCLDFTRSTAYCFPTASGIREQMNTLTSYVDASNLYGSDDGRSRQLREFSNGRLRVSKANPNLLPLVAEVEADTGENITFMGDFLAGDDRVNEMPALAVLHTLMVREHNRVAAEIFKRAPHLTDEEIFQQTRRIVIAEWQNVVFGEYLPIILGQNTMDFYGLSLPENPSGYSVYDSTIEAMIFHSFATAAYRFGHTLINGLVRLFRGMTEVGSYQVRDNFFVSDQLTQEGGSGYDLILTGLMTQNAQTYDECVTVDLTNFLLRDKKNDFGSDLAARNLQRGRDHGIQSYDAYRQYCKLTPLTTWANRPSEIRSEVWTRLATLYDSPQDIDLFVAGISEYPLEGAVSGPTFNCLKATQFLRLKNGDRFFFTHENQPTPFTPAQLSNLRSRTFGDIICENSKVEETPMNVFRTSVVPGNLKVRCNDPTRKQLDFDIFV